MTTTDPTDAPTPSSIAEQVPPGLWHNRDFNLLWGGLLLSSLGSTMSSLAFPLIVLALGGSAVIAGAVGTIGLVAELVCHLPSGVLVDRVDRRRLLIWCDLVRLTAFAGLGIALLTGHARIWLILAVVVIQAICQTPTASAVFAAIRNLVRPDQIKDAMARNEARQFAVSLAGPPLGGLLFSLGRAIPFLADAASYLFSLTAALLIRTPLQTARDDNANTDPWRDVLDGLKFVTTTPAIRSVVLIAAPHNLALNGVLFGIILVLRHHGLPPAAIGTASTMFAAGGLLGAFASGWLLRRTTVARLVQVFTISALPLLLLVWPLSSSPLAAAPLALLAFLSPALNAGLFGHLAAVIPDEMQGRVMSALMLTVTGLTSIAPLGAGLLVENLSAPGLAIGAAAVMAISTTMALTNAAVRDIA